MANEKVAIQINGLEKIYKLYDKPSDRLKEALGLSRRKRYKEHFALQGIDLTIYQGETVGIIGTNGSGKSTILKIITGVLNPSRGQVQVDGRISALLELGAGFNMEYNGIENVYLNGTMIGFSEKEIAAKMDAILEFADIGEYIYQPVKTYSSGMFVRLAFAVAINIEPEILIVDEALSVGDVFFQAKCYHKFDEFKKMGKTILFVSHDLSSISKYCDRVVLLNQGEKLGEGSPKEMIDAYKRVLVGQYEAVDDAVERSAENKEAGTAGAAGTDEGNQDDAVQAGTAQSENINKGTAQNQNIKRGTVQNGTDQNGADQNGTDQSETVQEKTAQDGTVQKGTVNGTRRAARGVGINPEVLEYGTKEAVIEECFVTDDSGSRVSAVLKGQDFTVHMKVRFEADITAPIFAFTIKNSKGTEITGTNSMVEKAFLEGVERGMVKQITFTQKMDLQGGEYLLSFGVTGFEKDEFQVYHRLYDVINITVISDKDTVGYYDMNSAVVVADAE